jgi:hypothetical protein
MVFTGRTVSGEITIRGPNWFSSHLKCSSADARLSTGPEWGEESGPVADWSLGVEFIADGFSAHDGEVKPPAKLSRTPRDSQQTHFIIQYLPVVLL